MEPASHPPRDVWAHVAWAGLFAVNLVVPLLFGLILTDRGGRVGMAAGVGAAFVIWQVVVPRRAALRAALVPGAMALAFSQYLPLVQFCAGAVAVGVVSAGREPFAGSPLAEWEGFAATVLTGALLWWAAVVFGVALRLADRCLVWAFDRLAVVDAAGRPGTAGRPHARDGVRSTPAASAGRRPPGDVWCDRTRRYS